MTGKGSSVQVDALNRLLDRVSVLIGLDDDSRGSACQEPGLGQINVPGACSVAPDPVHVGLIRALHVYREHQDLGRAVAVQLTNARRECLDLGIRRLDQQRALLLLVDHTLPHVHAAHAGQDVHTGREASGHEGSREPLGFVDGAVAEDDDHGSIITNRDGQHEPGAICGPAQSGATPNRAR